MKYQITLAIHIVDENKRGQRENEIMRQIRKAGMRGKERKREEWRGKERKGEERRGEEKRGEEKRRDKR